MQQSLPVCAACLVTGARMHSMTGGLLHSYQLIVGRQINERIPPQACWECAALLNKFNMFRHKCERAYLLLQEILSIHSEITYQNAGGIDRQQHGLNTAYGISKTVKEDIKTKARSLRRNFPKPEPIETAEVAAIKLEEDLEPSISEFCASDDDTLSLHTKLLNKCEKRKRIHERRERRKEKAVKEKSINDDASLKVTDVSIRKEETKQAFALRNDSIDLETHPHKCSFCSKAFRDRRACSKHQERHDVKRGAHECEVCSKRFTTAEILFAHTANHLKKFTCNISSKVNHTRAAAEKHSRMRSKRGTVSKPKKKGKCSRVTARAEDFGAVEIVLSQEQQMEAVRERQNARGFATARFKCTLCYKTFNEQKTYSNHMVLHGPVSGELECDICKLRYNSRLKIFKHITNNHMRKYACQLCTHVCYNRSFALNHYRWHKGVVYKCNICEATFDKKTSHRSHLRVKHPSEHVCGTCAEPFVSSSGLQQHVNRMHSLKPDGKASEATGPYCVACDVQFASAAAWTRHILISPKHEHEKHTVVNGCQYCGETLPTPEELKAHYVALHRRHKRTFKPALHERFPAPCAQCDEVMLSAGKYWQHFRQRHPGKDFPLTRSSFICEHCGNWFKYKSALEAHKLTHSERRQCAECPKRFVSAESLAAHARSHAPGGGGGTEFSCDVCGRQFTYKRSLTNHFRKHTVEKPHSCEWCGKTFAYDCNLRRHELATHSEPPPGHVPFT